MREKLWKKIEKVIANDQSYRLARAGTVEVDEEAGFEIILIKMIGVDLPEPMAEKKVNREPLRCKLGFHRWAKWGDVYQLGVLEFQKRSCVSCNRGAIRILVT